MVQSIRFWFLVCIFFKCIFVWFWWICVSVSASVNVCVSCCLFLVLHWINLQMQIRVRRFKIEFSLILPIVILCFMFAYIHSFDRSFVFKSKMCDVCQKTKLNWFTPKSNPNKKRNKSFFRIQKIEMDVWNKEGKKRVGILDKQRDLQWEKKTSIESLKITTTKIVEM